MVVVRNLRGEYGLRPTTQTIKCARVPKPGKFVDIIFGQKILGALWICSDSHHYKFDDIPND